MLQGENRLVKWTERATLPFSLSSPSMATTKPDGTIVDGDATANPNAGASTSFVLSGLVDFDQAGYYEIKWIFTTGSGANAETNVRRQPYFAFWTDVPASLRYLMGGGVGSSITDAEIDRMAAAVVRRILDRWTCIGEYSDLTGADKLRFDDGLAYMLAANMQYSSQRGGPYGNIEVMKQGDLMIQYAKGSDPVLNFLGQAGKLFATVSCIKEMFASIASNSKMFQVASPTRAMVANGIMPSMITTLASLLDADALYASGTI